MVRKPLKPCNKVGCTRIVASAYCEEHQPVDDRKARDERYDENRDIRELKFYSSGSWRKLRNHKMKRNPLCEHCEQKNKITPANAVDHVVPIQTDWSQRLVYNNLQSLCWKCHRLKTIEDKKG